MSSLTQLLATHPRLLVLDAASTRVQVGLLSATEAPRWHQAETDAGSGLFAAVASVMADGPDPVGGVDAFVFCEGPGSMLGIRTVAMAVRTWQTLRARPAYAYQSLAVAGCHERRVLGGAVTVIADARRDTWHVQAVPAEGAPGPLQRVASAALPSGGLLMPENFRTWTPLPATLKTCSYDLAQILPAIAGLDLFRPSAAPDAFQHEAPDYKKWNAQVHSAANATK